MSVLQASSMRFDIPVANLERAKEFYAKRLGLEPTYDNHYCSQFRYKDSYFVLTPSESAGRAEHSLLTWLVNDIKAAKAEIEDRGVDFIEYDTDFLRTVNGIATIGTDRIAWFKDSEGNILAIAEVHS